MVADLELEFALAYCRFGGEEWKTELSNDLSRLRRLQGSFADRTVSTFNGLNAEMRESLSMGLLHRGHRRAVETLGLTLGAREVEALRLWDEGLVGEGSFAASALPPPSRLSKASLAKEIRSRLAAFGEIEEMGSKLTWRHTIQNGRYTILTYVDLAGRVWDLSYHHAVMLGDVRIHRSASFLTWLGIGPTKWNLASSEDGRRAATLLAELCQHFFSSLPRLLPE
jgi:hypothetical protein